MDLKDFEAEIRKEYTTIVASSNKGDGLFLKQGKTRLRLLLEV